MIISFRTLAASTTQRGEHDVRGSRMGRGRQKAKHTKVARDLKYFSPDTNYNDLERELAPHTDAHAGWSEEDFAGEETAR